MRVGPLVLVAVSLLLAPATLASKAQPSVARLFPPPDVPREDVPALVVERLGLRPDYVLGVMHGSRSDAVPSGEGAYNVTVRPGRADGNFDAGWSVEQRVHREEGTLRLVRPADLHEAVELQDPFVVVLAPQGRFPGDGSGEADRAEAYARRLGLPPVEPAAWNVTPYDEARSPKPLILFAGAFPFPPHFTLDCAECAVAVRRMHPLDTVNVNFAVATFAADGSLVAFQASDFVDADDPRVLPRAEAERLARDALEEAGYPVESMEFRGHALNEGWRLVYKWSAGLGPGARDGWTHAGVEQDALTGALAGGPWTTSAATGGPAWGNGSLPGEGEGGKGERREAPGITAVLALAMGAALLQGPGRDRARAHARVRVAEPDGAPALLVLAIEVRGRAEAGRVDAAVVPHAGVGGGEEERGQQDGGEECAQHRPGSARRRT